MNSKESCADMGLNMLRTANESEKEVRGVRKVADGSKWAMSVSEQNKKGHRD